MVVVWCGVVVLLPIINLVGLHTKNQHPRLSRTALIVIIPGVVVVWWCGGVVWCGGFITDYKTTPTKVVLSCFGLLVGLWQLVCTSNLSCQELASLNCFLRLSN